MNNSQYVDEEPQLDLEEPVNWLHYEHVDDTVCTEPDNWCCLGATTNTVEALLQQCSLFAQQSTVRRLLDAKALLTCHSGEVLRRARRRCGVFETIGSGPFMNRAAMKLANLDARLDFMFSRPAICAPSTSASSMAAAADAGTNGHIAQDTDSAAAGQLLYFADLCGGPGGFTEYMLWRRGWRARALCITLRHASACHDQQRGDSIDMRPGRMSCAPALNVDVHYGEGGAAGDGDILRDENQLAFGRFVRHRTSQRGVHVVLADGGFDVSGREALQEALSRRLYLCQCLVALDILRVGGNFVCKLFDVFSLFSVGLLYLMYRSFHSVAIVKPNTSRPANSERYLVCRRRRDDVSSVLRHLRHVNLLLSAAATGDGDVIQLVPAGILQADARFGDYVAQSNRQLAERQIEALQRLAACCRRLSCPSSSTTSPLDKDQIVEAGLQLRVRHCCLQRWLVPATWHGRVASGVASEPRGLLRELDCVSYVERLMLCLRHGSVVPHDQWAVSIDTASLAQQLHPPPSSPAMVAPSVCRLGNDDGGWFVACSAGSAAAAAMSSRLCLLLAVRDGRLWRLPVADVDGGEPVGWKPLQLSLLLPAGTLLLAEMACETADWPVTFGRRCPCCCGAGTTPTGVCEEETTPTDVIEKETTPAGIIKKDITPTGVIEEETTPTGVIEKETTPSGVSEEETTPTGVIVKETTPTVVVKKETTTAGVIKKDNTPAGVIEEETTPSGVIEKETTPTGVIEEETTPSGASKKETTPTGVILKETTPTVVVKKETTTAGVNGEETTPTGVSEEETTPTGTVEEETTPTGGAPWRRPQRKRCAVHALDALFLAGEDVRHCSAATRRQLLVDFVTAVCPDAACENCRQMAAALRVKRERPISQLGAFIDKVWASGGRYTVCERGDVHVHCPLISVILLNDNDRHTAWRASDSLTACSATPPDSQSGDPPVADDALLQMWRASVVWQCVAPTQTPPSLTRNQWRALRKRQRSQRLHSAPSQRKQRTAEPA